MRILLIASAYNGLTQRAHVELDALGYEVSITLALSSEEMIRAVALFAPNLIICPFLREKVPADIWQNHTCIIIHPGIKGDRGPSSLDWAISDNLKEWGITALQAADRVCARAGCIMNPHYKTMGLYGSEYWTYLLPKRVGSAKALELTQISLPVGMQKARAIGLIDDILSDDYDAFQAELIRIAESMAHDSAFEHKLHAKRQQRVRDEQIKPLASYRAAELKKMKMNFSGHFYGGDQNYHEARYNFVHKIRPQQTAEYLAKHLRFDFEQFKELRQPPTY